MTASPSPERGGVYRVGWASSFSFTDGFDPTGEYLGDAWGIYDNLLLRTLVGYEHRSGAPGNRLVADLAASVPIATDHGLTYVFHLRPDVDFGPPVDREITSADVMYALERLANPANGGEYSSYYAVIRGWQAYADGRAHSISGIRTPDSRTIVFTLIRRTGDFLYRLAMPATAPIPREVARCFTGARASLYGRDVVSSGPYMVEGADHVHASSCSALEPMSGFDGQTTLRLVRNPDYDQSTDRWRRNFPDEFVFSIDSNPEDILDKVQAGELDDEVGPVPPPFLRAYSTTPALRPRLHVTNGDRTAFLTLNLTQPPFDDVRVRRALNWIVDKAALRKAWGGAIAGPIATHLLPPTLTGPSSAHFDPYRTPGEHGDLAKARSALRGSRYDTTGDGICSAPACKHVELLSAGTPTDEAMLPVLEASAAKIGITFDVRTVSDPFPVLEMTSNNVPISDVVEWGKDYADPSVFFDDLFQRTSIHAHGNSNFSFVGLTPAIAHEDGIRGDVRGLPRLDAPIARCSVLHGPARQTCWDELDRTMMTKVVPIVPYLWGSKLTVTGPRVTRWAFDQFSGTTAYSRVAVRG